MKRVKKLLLAIALIIAMIPVVNATNNVFVIRMDGKVLDTADATTYIDEQGRTMVPVRFIGEFADYKVDFDGVNKTAVFTPKKSSGQKVAVTNGRTYVNMRNKYLPMDTYAVIKEGRMYAPLRYIANALNYTVNYSNTNNNGTITHYIDLSLSPTTVVKDSELLTWEQFLEDEGKVPEGITIVNYNDPAYMDKATGSIFLGGIFIGETGIAIKNPEWAYDKTLTIDEHFSKMEEIMDYLGYGYTPNGFVWNDPYPESVIGGGSLSLTKVDDNPSVARLWVSAWRGVGDIGSEGRINVTINQYLNVCRYWMPNAAANDWYAFVDDMAVNRVFEPSKYNFECKEIATNKYQLIHKTTGYSFIWNDSTTDGSFSILMPLDY